MLSVKKEPETYNLCIHIEEMVRQSNPRELLLSERTPERPLEKETDVCHYKGSEFLLCEVWFPEFPEFTTTTREVVSGAVCLFDSRITEKNYRLIFIKLIRRV